MRCLPQRREHPEIARPHDRIHRKTLHCHGQCRGNLYCKNDTVDIAGGMRFISQLFLVVSLDEQAAVWIGRAFTTVFIFFASFLRFFSFFLEVLSRFFLGQHRIMQLCGVALNLGRITDTLRHIQESIILDRNFRILPYARFQVGHLKQRKAVWRAK